MLGTFARRCPGLLLALSIGWLPMAMGQPQAPSERANTATPDRKAEDASKRQSATAVMSPAVQALQRDDSQNPAMLWVKGGEAQWQQAPAENAPSCQKCHGAATSSMKGVAARYPRAFEAAGKPAVMQTLAQRINQCRTEKQNQPRLTREADALLQLESYLGMQSRGMPITAPAHPLLDAADMRGSEIFKQRMGQLDLSCAHCHDERAGKSLGGSVIPQGHPTGYPIYRLEWQSVGSLNRRLRNCMVGVRAEPFAPDASQWQDLEVYLMRRAAGMPLETPAVRP